MLLQCKLDAIASYGAEIEQSAPGIDAREAACAKVQQRTGARFIPPYNHAHIMAGQARSPQHLRCMQHCISDSDVRRPQQRRCMGQLTACAGVNAVVPLTCHKDAVCEPFMAGLLTLHDGPWLQGA